MTVYATPVDMLRQWLQQQPDKVYMRQPVNRQYRDFTWQRTADLIGKVVTGLRQMGLVAGDRVSLMSKNCAEYYIADFAISVAGMVSVPIYPTAGADIISYVLDHAGVKAIFVGKLDSLDACKAGVPGHITRIALPYDTIECELSWQDWLADKTIATDFVEPDQDDLFSIVYTSGSTGRPKGVELNYRNIASGAISAIRRASMQPEDRLISYLPLAHIIERAHVEYMSLYAGCEIRFSESLETFAEDLRMTAPSTFFTVPRLWMKFQAAILSKLPQEKLDVLLADPATRVATQQKLRAQLGLENARITGAGSAPISLAVLRWWQSIGINISEGWGMTETTGAATSHNPFRDDKIGTIGPAIDGADVTLSDDGEILVRGDGVTRGYYRDPERTAEAFIDGWLRTGDRGEIDQEGYVRITGRMKDIFKTAKGKYVAPLPIETLLFENQLVEQACVMGSGLAQPVALVNLSAALVGARGREDLAMSLQGTLDKVNRGLESHQKLDAILVVEEDWSIENGLLTATMKIRRDALEDRYIDRIPGLLGRPVAWLS